MNLVEPGVSDSAQALPMRAGDRLSVLDPDFELTHVEATQFGTRTFNLLHPEIIRHCFITNSPNYAQAQARKRLMEPVLGESILTGEGELSRQVRQSLSGVFNRESLDRYSDRMVEKTLRLLDGTASGLHSISYLTSRLALENLSDTLFSSELDDTANDILAALDAIYDSMDGLQLTGSEGGIDYYPRIRRRARNEATGKLRTILAELVSKRLEPARKDMDQDLLDRLIRLRIEISGTHATREQMVDDAVTFVFAGHETTATVVSWALYMVSQAPKVLAGVRAEADAMLSGARPGRDWIDQMPLTLASIEETQRLYPPVPVLTRQALEDDLAADVRISAGSLVTLPVRLIHRMPRYWQEPEAFLPERFLPQNRAEISALTFMPFGLGPRMCIGSQFGNREAMLMLACILGRFDVEYAGDAIPKAELKVVMRTDNGMPFKLHRR